MLACLMLAGPAGAQEAETGGETLVIEVEADVVTPDGEDAAGTVIGTEPAPPVIDGTEDAPADPVEATDPAETPAYPAASPGPAVGQPGADEPVADAVLAEVRLPRDRGRAAEPNPEPRGQKTPQPAICFFAPHPNACFGMIRTEQIRELCEGQPDEAACRAAARDHVCVTNPRSNGCITYLNTLHCSDPASFECRQWRILGGIACSILPVAYPGCPSSGGGSTETTAPGLLASVNTDAVGIVDPGAAGDRAPEAEPPRKPRKGSRLATTGLDPRGLLAAGAVLLAAGLLLRRRPAGATHG